MVSVIHRNLRSVKFSVGLYPLSIIDLHMIKEQGTAPSDTIKEQYRRNRSGKDAKQLELTGTPSSAPGRPWCHSCYVVLAVLKSHFSPAS